MNIILGSGSRFRKQLMEAAGYTFSVLVPDLDERAFRTPDPYDLPLRLAKEKAKELLPKISEPSLLITSDTIVISNGRVYEKPMDSEEVRAFMREYSAAKYTDVVTTLLVTNTATGKQVSETDICRVEFDSIPDAVAREFIRTGDPYSRAGGFAIEDKTLAPYIRLVQGTRDSFMGLPLEILQRLLQEAQKE